MYRFSRSIYRDLLPYVIAEPANGNGNGQANVTGDEQESPTALVNGNGHAPASATGSHNGVSANGHGGAGVAGNRRRLLDACEATMRRLAYDRRYFAHPARSLFCEVRTLFPLHEQDRVFRVIDRNVSLALEHLARLPEDGVGVNGQLSECRAHTRKGAPCQRAPVPGRDYCPSHKHLEESLEPVEEIDALDERPAEPQDPVGAAA